MGEIADLGAGAFQDLAIGVEEQIQLARQRRDVTRVFARDALRLPLPDGAERAAEIRQGP
jgi:hypothetical protein